MLETLDLLAVVLELKSEGRILRLQFLVFASDKDNAIADVFADRLADASVAASAAASVAASVAAFADVDDIDVAEIGEVGHQFLRGRNVIVGVVNDRAFAAAAVT